ncbi:site-2 protease family protein [Gorillibacterium timonense]|uniref:site-2 protease family protein n=1 Tax=Gorillibacterium timonense TaxID=1689269 RepID=UPI00071E0BCB|nr:site-2 protease family protein [Gorillibacterium timonense]
MGLTELTAHPERLPFYLLVLMLAFAFHEFAHAYSADRFGDPTPRSMGRVTLNPRVHLDLLGTILILLVGFGWAKPVLINPNHFRRPRLMNLIVSVAGPLANLVLAALGMLGLYILQATGAFDSMSHGVLVAVSLFFTLHIMLNLVLFLFNLLPIPPLDGYRILESFLPLSLRIKLAGVTQWFVFVFLLFVFVPSLSSVTIGRLFALRWPIMAGIDQGLSVLFGFSFNWDLLVIPS